MKKYITFIFLFLFLLKTEILFCQYKVDAPNVDLIIYHTEVRNFRLYQKKGENKYVEILLEYDVDNNGFYSIRTENYGVIKDFKDIFRINKKVVFVKDLKKSTFNDLKNKQWLINSNYDDTDNVLKFLSPDLSVIQKFYYGKLNNNHSGVINKKNDSIKKWRIYDSNCFQNIKLDFGNDKYIYLINDRYGTKYVFIPLKKDTVVLTSNGAFNTTESTKYKSNYTDTFRSFYSYDYYHLQKNKNNKYELFNFFKKNILLKEFDTIIYNKYFIIAKNNKNYTIYDSYIRRKNIPNIKSAHLYRKGLEILTDNGPHYYNSDLKIVKDFPPIIYMRCGSRETTFYKIEKKLPFSVIKTSYWGTRTYRLKGLKKKDSIAFLNNSTQYGLDMNEGLIENQYVFPDLLKIKRKNKFGIVNFKYPKNITLSSSLSFDEYNNRNIKEDVYLPSSINLKIVLPIKYDSIHFKKKDGLIYFYKNNCVGIFPRHKKVRYRKITQETNSFYAIIRKGEKGWLDIKSNIEYFEK